jgi:hypothetical protein
MMHTKRRALAERLPMSGSGGFGPHVVLCLLYEKTSSKGAQYFVGRLGKAKIAVLRSRESSESGDLVWEVRLEQAPERPLKPSSATVTAANSLFRTPARRLPNAERLPDVPDDPVGDLYDDGAP